MAEGHGGPLRHYKPANSFGIMHFENDLGNKRNRVNIIVSSQPFEKNASISSDLGSKTRSLEIKVIRKMIDSMRSPYSVNFAKREIMGEFPYHRHRK